MIIKSFEITKIDLKKNHLFLLYGENEGFKLQAIKKEFENKFLGETQKYEEKEILNNENVFFDSINSKSFFEKEKLIIINRCTDKLKDTIEEIVEKKIRVEFPSKAKKILGGKSLSFSLEAATLSGLTSAYMELHSE